MQWGAREDEKWPPFCVMYVSRAGPLPVNPDPTRVMAYYITQIYFGWTMKNFKDDRLSP